MNFNAVEISDIQVSPLNAASSYDPTVLGFEANYSNCRSPAGSGYLANEAKQAAAFYIGSTAGGQAKDATIPDIAKAS